MGTPDSSSRPQVKRCLPAAGRRVRSLVDESRAAREYGFATDEEKIVVVAGIPFGQPGSTNILRVAFCDERKIYAGGGED